MDITPDCVTVADDTDGTTASTDVDQDPNPGKFKLTGLRLGRYTVHETVAPPGFEPSPTT